MSIINPNNNFSQEKVCIYKNELYNVRDNGAVFRHPLDLLRKRPTDNNWTYGKLNTKSGYLEIASVSIHRIVATAFHGDPPTKNHVVDHIDTNKQNNRPQNLRWVTRLENILLNPITARRIELVCGSVEAFLADPSKFRDKFQDPNYEWMCTVSKEEARISLDRMQNWAKSGNQSQGGSLGKWIFNREIVEPQTKIQPNYIMSKTINAAQGIVFNFEDKPNEYPSTPKEFIGNPLSAYIEQLTEGAIFFRNHNGEYVVVKSGYSKDKNSLWVITKAAYEYVEQEDGEWLPVKVDELSEKKSDRDLHHSLSEIIYKDGLFIHKKIGTGFHHSKEELLELFDLYTQRK